MNSEPERLLLRLRARVRHPRMLLLRAYAITALASGAAWAVASSVSSMPWTPVLVSPIVAAITAVLTVRTSLHAASSTAGGQVLATAIGAGAALVISTAGLPAWAGAMLAVFVALGIAWVLKLGDEAGLAIPITALIVLGPGLHEAAAVERFAGTLVGGLIGVLASILTHPDTPAQRAADLVAALGDDTAMLLGQLAEGGRRRFSTREALEWLDTARQVNDRTADAKSACEEAVAYASWSPHTSKAEAAALYARFLAVEHTVITVRAIARSMLEVAERNVTLPKSTRTALGGALDAAAIATETHASTIADSVVAAVEAIGDDAVPGLLPIGMPSEVEMAISELTETTADLARSAEAIATGNSSPEPDQAAGLTAAVAVALQRIADSLSMDTAAISAVSPEPAGSPATNAVETLASGVSAPALMLRRRRRRAIVRKAGKARAARRNALASRPERPAE